MSAISGTENLRTRVGVSLGALVLALVWAAPNLIDVSKLPWWPTQSKMTMGLDIQGGLHLVMRVDIEGALKVETTRLSAELPIELERDKLSGVRGTVGDALRGEITLEGAPAAQVSKFVTDRYGNTFNVASAEGNTTKLEYSELHVRDFSKRMVEQGINTIRNRIDEFGVAEPSISAQGEDRILVQLPGIQDAANAKELINKTARLDFMIVDTTVGAAELQGLIDTAEKDGGFKLGGDVKYSAYVDKLNEALKGKIPANTLVLFEKAENAESLEAGRIPYLLKTTEMVTGDTLTDAHVAPGEYGNPVVSFAFNAVGTRLFGDLTRRNNKQYMAIVLDKVVKSAPVINEPITGGRGQITLGGGRDYNKQLNEAKLISMALKSGALPAALEQLEERTVGPSLGADAIAQGAKGAMVAAAFVFIFMFGFYRSFGLLANLALGLNLAATLAVLSALGATLTLPGIAGLALGLGISVDSSVIIFERIKEEMAKGLTMAQAIREGFDRAMSSIFDANLVSIAVCLVLMYYGTGPVRGFAITLVTGLVITLFTAVFFTRSLLDLLVLKWKLNPSIKW